MKKTTLCIFILLSVTAGDIYSQFEKEYPLYKYYGITGQFQPIIDKAVNNAHDKLSKILNKPISYKPEIYVAGSRERFKELVGGAFPDWGAAAALPYRGKIILKSPAHFNVGKSLTELTMHEFAHLALADRVGGQDVPRWIDEGVAMYTAAEWGWMNNLAMGRAAVFNSLIPLHEIEKLNSFGEGKASIAYAESYLAVKYIIDNYGIESFNILLDQLSRRSGIDRALTEAIGATYIEFEKEFHKHLAGRYNVISLFTDTYFLWIFLAFVVIVGFILKARKRQKYYKKWEEDEKYHSTDFDYGDPDNPEQVDDEDKPWT